MFRIVRFYFDAQIRRRVIKTSLTEEQAKEHCSNPQTSSSTCASAVGKRRTKQLGAWFDGYEESK